MDLSHEVEMLLAWCDERLALSSYSYPNRSSFISLNLQDSTKVHVSLYR